LGAAPPIGEAWLQAPVLRDAGGPLMLAAFAVAMGSRSLLSWRRDVLLAQRHAYFLDTRRLSIATGLARASWPASARLEHGRVMQIMGGDLTRVTAGAHFIVQGAKSATTLGALAVTVVLLAPAQGVAILAILGLGAVATGRLAVRARDSGGAVSQANRSVTTGVGTFLRAMKAAKSQGLQEPFLTDFARELGEASRAQVAFQSQQALVRAAWPLLAAAAVGAIVLAAGIGGLRGGPTVVAVLLLLWRMVGPATQLQNGVQQVAFALPAWESIQELEAELAAGKEARCAHGGPPPEGVIALRGVTVSHGDAGGVVGVDLEIAPGEWLGLAGPTGAGKTTIADVIAGLRCPDEGEVLVGGKLLYPGLVEPWRSSLAYVPQDPFLINDTVRTNLSWGRPQVNEAQMMAALSLMGAAKRFAGAGGLDAAVGENGSLISGGERQRLALGRALLGCPRLMIMDESTNAIDPEGELGLLTALRAAAPEMTVVLIAHRRETLSACDRVVVLENGRISAEHSGETWRRQARSRRSQKLVF
jgi:ATP-binding cassette subfamily C protein